MRAVLVDAPRATPENIQEFQTRGFQAVVLLLKDRDTESVQSSAERVRKAGLDLYYWIEVARNVDLAEEHPGWMASLQGHKDWRKRFESHNNPGPGEVAKTYPWVPILYKETFAAHLERVERLLRDLPDARGLFLNDLQGGPSACGCGSTFCRWTSDYGAIRTATPYTRPERHFSTVVSAAADFVQTVQQRRPSTEVIPVWLTECEEHDKPGICGNVGCYRGYCWMYYERQLDLLVPNVRRLGVLATFKSLGRDLPVYGEKAGWVKWALDTYRALPPAKEKKVIESERLLAVLQGWDVTDEEIEAQIQKTVEARAGGYVLALVEIDQSWEPRLVQYERP